MRARGFTLLELIVVLGVLAICLLMLIPVAQSGTAKWRERETRVALERTVQGIYGDAATGSGGFLGDLGRLPDPSLRELLQKGALPAAQWIGGVPVGWSGPYLDATSVVPTDGWHNPLRLDADARVRSAGPNGKFDDDDDIVAPPYPPLPKGTRGSLCVEVLLALSGGAARAATAAEAVVYAIVPDGAGNPVRVPAATDAAGCAFFFASLPSGRRLVIAAGGGPASGLIGSEALIVPRGGPAAGRVVLGGST